MGKIIDHNNFWYIEKNPISKTGVFPYLGREIGFPGLEPNKIYYVLRSEQELMSPEAIKSFELLPITKGHRMLGPQDQGLTPAEKIPQQGIVGEKVFAEGDTLYANIKVTSEQAKNDINNGLKELSLGYFCRWVKESGEYKGRHYDFAQKNIRGNHLAIVPLGRMGHDVRVMDSLPVGAASYACDSLELAGPFVSALLPAGHIPLKLFNLPGQEQDEDKWITIYPNGRENKGRPLKIEEGESAAEAINRVYKADLDVKSPEEDVKSIEEAEKFLTQKLKIREVSYGSFPLDMAKEMNKAIATLPEDHRPIFVGNASEAYKRAGLERDRPLNTFYGVNLSSDKIGEEGEYVIGINTQKYKSFESIEKRKKEVEAAYQKKTGKKYFFNTSGKATLYHEAGHVYLNKGVLPAGFELAAERWYRESGYESIKPNNEGFGGKYDEAFAEAWAGYFTQNPELPDYIAKFISDIVAGNDGKDEKTEKQDIFTPSAELAERFKKEVQAVLADDSISKNHLLDMGTIPPLYIKLGLPDSKLKINKMTMLKALGKGGRHAHDVPQEVLENLPALISDPEGIFKSSMESTNPKGFVAVLNAVNKDGKQILAAISPNEKGESGFNFIPSVYDKKNFENFVNKTNNENGIIYIKEKGSDLWGPLQSRPLHSQSLINKILTKEDFVKDLDGLKKEELSDMSITEMLENAEDGMNLFIEEADHAGDDWDESKHKRDADGKFTSGGGAAEIKRKQEERAAKKAEIERRAGKFEAGTAYKKAMENNPNDKQAAMIAEARSLSKWSKTAYANPQSAKSVFFTRASQNDYIKQMSRGWLEDIFNSVKGITSWQTRIDKAGNKTEFKNVEYKGYTAEIRKNGKVVEYTTNFKPDGYNGGFYKGNASNAEVAEKVIKAMIERKLGNKKEAEKLEKEALERNHKSDLDSTKTNGTDGISAAPEDKESIKMDKRKVIEEIMAIAAKPADEFKDGKEEQIRTIAGLAEKLAYNKSKRGANDEDAAKDKDKAEDAMEARIAANFAKKASLYEKISPFIGTFDHNPMSFTQMAKYACDKLGIKGIAEDGAETALIGYLAGAKKQAVVRQVKGASLDAAPESDAAFENYLKEAE